VLSANERLLERKTKKHSARTCKLACDLMSATCSTDREECGVTGGEGATVGVAMPARSSDGCATRQLIKDRLVNWERQREDWDACCRGLVGEEGASVGQEDHTRRAGMRCTIQINRSLFQYISAL